MAFVGAFSVMRGGLTVGSLSALLSYANQYMKPFNEISGVVTELQNAIACAGRVIDLIDETPMKKDPDNELVVKMVRVKSTLRMYASLMISQKNLLRILISM